MAKAFIHFLKDKRGVTSIEYALIAGLVSIVIVGAITGIGTRLNNKFLGPVATGLS